MGNRVTRTVSITPQAETILKRNPSLNASSLFEEAIWAMATKTQKGGAQSKEAFVRTALKEAQEVAEKTYEENMIEQSKMEEPFKERFVRLINLWRSAVKEFGFESPEEKETSEAIDALILEAQNKGVTLKRPAYANTNP